MREQRAREIASTAHTPTTPLRWRHSAVHVAKQRSCDPNGRPNGFLMDFQWIFNGCFFSIFFFITLESSRSQWIFFLMGPLMDLLMERGGPMDFKWIFNGTFNGCFFSIFFCDFGIYKEPVDLFPNGPSNGSCNGSGRTGGRMEGHGRPHGFSMEISMILFACFFGLWHLQGQWNPVEFGVAASPCKPFCFFS